MKQKTFQIRLIGTEAEYLLNLLMDRNCVLLNKQRKFAAIFNDKDNSPVKSWCEERYLLESLIFRFR